MNEGVILQFILKDFARVIAFGASVRLLVTVAIARIYRASLYGIAEFEPLLMSAALNSRAAAPFRNDVDGVSEPLVNWGKRSESKSGWATRTLIHGATARYPDKC